MAFAILTALTLLQTIDIIFATYCFQCTNCPALSPDGMSNAVEDCGSQTSCSTVFDISDMRTTARYCGDCSGNERKFMGKNPAVNAKNVKCVECKSSMCNKPINCYDCEKTCDDRDSVTNYKLCSSYNSDCVSFSTAGSSKMQRACGSCAYYDSQVLESLKPLTCYECNEDLCNIPISCYTCENCETLDATVKSVACGENVTKCSIFRRSPSDKAQRACGSCNQIGIADSCSDCTGNNCNDMMYTLDCQESIPDTNTRKSDFKTKSVLCMKKCAMFHLGNPDDETYRLCGSCNNFVSLAEFAKSRRRELRESLKSVLIKSCYECTTGNCNRKTFSEIGASGFPEANYFLIFFVPSFMATKIV